MQIHQTVPAPAPVATWLRNLLLPAAQAAGIKNPPPLEIRPCGAWGGWALDKSRAPDGRVSIDRRALFQRPAGLVSIYLHEATHQLLGERAAQPHGVEFYTLNLCLLKRLDAADYLNRQTLWAWTADPYDYQDCPPPLAESPCAHWMPRVHAWALNVSEELAPTKKTAEELAAEICARASKWYLQLEAEPDQKVQRERQLNWNALCAKELPKVQRHLRWAKRVIYLLAPFAAFSLIKLIWWVRS